MVLLVVAEMRQVLFIIARIIASEVVMVIATEPMSLPGTLTDRMRKRNRLWSWR
jgi:archaellum component FlaG (FlaF/FlaG flagellin family)